MHNMLIRPSNEELETFGNPDFTILNAGAFPANRYTTGMTSTTSVGISFRRREMVILGTRYAGEMKKGIFTVMNYLMPAKGVLSLHASANVSISDESDVTLFFGLSGTGKTTLSTDENRLLIGDDEQCWSEQGVFNIEGGCYAKCINLNKSNEPEIYDAIRFGTVLENVVLEEESRHVIYTDSSITENTRAAYPIEHIPKAKIPCVAKHPRNIIMLTCDAFSILPPVSRLSIPQAMYHFISGYTAKISGTEEGVLEPTATFSSCFGAPFLVRHPTVYARMLADRLRDHAAQAWLVNTGWIGGSPGCPTAKRCPLNYTRAIINAIHDGSLNTVDYEVYPIFNLQVPKSCPGLPVDILHPEKAWKDRSAFESTRIKVAGLFCENFSTYADFAGPDVVTAGPSL